MILAILSTIFLIGAIFLSSTYATITFNNKPVTNNSSVPSISIAENLVNPINQVTSGSIIYKLPNTTRLTQIALDTKVEMNIAGVVNRVRLEQSFTNPSNEWVEGVYVFPLPEDSAVDRLTMHIHCSGGQQQENT